MSTTENIAGQVKTTYEQYKKIKTLVDVGYFLKNYVVSGGEVTKDIKHNDQIDVSEIVVSLDNDVTWHETISFKTKIPNTTYFLDYRSDGMFNFDTAHYMGLHLTIAEITTDANGNVSVITDKRGDVGGFRLKGDTGLRVTDYNIPNTLKLIHTGSPVSIVFVGDSIGGGAGASSEYTTWSNLLSSKLVELYPAVEFSFHNSSMGGTGTSWLRENWNELVPPYNPDLLLMYHGTNDTGESDDTVRSNYSFFKEQIDKIGAEMIVSTTSTNSFSPASYGNTPIKTVYEAIEHEAQLVREIANKNNWGYADCNLVRHKFLTSIGVDYNSTFTHFDHIHPNDLGHRLIAYAFIMPFLGGMDTTSLDDRYAGKNMNTCDDHKTLFDLNKLFGQVNEWERYGLYHQQVTAGGLWIQNQQIGFKTARLWGTTIITGDEPYEPAVPFKHIRAREKDFISFEVDNAKYVWTQLHGSSSEPTDFEVIVNGKVVMTLSISSSNVAPIEIEYDTGIKEFPKGTHIITIRRKGEIPGVHYVEFYGFVVRHHRFNNPENQFFNRIPKLINSKNIETTSKSVAKKNGIVYPFGYSDNNPGFIFPNYGACVLVWKFWGTEVRTKLGTISGAMNSVLVYIDGEYRQTLDLKSDPIAQNIYTLGEGLSRDTEHELLLIGIMSQINLFSLISIGDQDINFGVCGSSIPLTGYLGKLPNILITPYYPEPGIIPITNTAESSYMFEFPYGDWTLGTGGLDGLDYMQAVSQNSQVKIYFHGEELKLRFAKASVCGVFNVTIDGVDKGDVDCNNGGTFTLATQTYSGLPDGYHEMILTKKDGATSIIYIYDMQQSGITVPTFQYVSELTPTHFKVTGSGEFIYTVY